MKKILAALAALALIICASSFFTSCEDEIKPDPKNRPTVNDTIKKPAPGWDYIPYYPIPY